MRACALSDLPEEGAVRVVLDGVPVCVARSGGEVFAINDVCSHADVSLSEGDVEDGHIE
ncbi:MAG: Rieske 2Fe-2S domain-containing protein, partial [Mycobacteriales bacterium]